MGPDTFHKGKYYVAFRRNGDDHKKDVTINIIRMFENDCLKILLSNEEDPSFLCILNVTRPDYEDLKKQQGLLIDFDNFPAQLVRLLQQCAANNMFLILQQSNPLQYYFEIVEHNEFRRLVHLSLKTAPATDHDIKKHMADTITSLKKTLSNLKHSSSNSEALWNEKCISMERKIHDLTITVSKMEEDKLRRETEFQDAIRREKDRMSQERLEWQKGNEVLTKSQTVAMQEVITRREIQIEDFNAQCKKLQENIKTLELQLSDKSQRLSILEREVQTSHIEVATTKAKNATLERDIMEKDNFIHQIRAKSSDYEKTIKENSDQIKDLNSKIHLLKREKTSLEERMALSDSLASKNNEAARLTSDQLFKANQIISKQNADLMEIKEKLLCRTAIALEQEKVIEKNMKEIEDLNIELNDNRVNMEKVKSDLDNLKEKFERNENSLREKEETIKNNNLVIQWLHKKMEDNCINTASSQKKYRQGNTMAASSTPYLMTTRNTDSPDVSEELPNFYATSRISETGDSPKTEVLTRNGRMGLDPKYLQPAPYDSQKKDENTTKKSTEITNNKGKENKNINLPKVDYRDKKTSKSSTYRATPVSAYFP